MIMAMGREGNNGNVVPVKKNKCAGSWNWLLMDASGIETIVDVDKYEIMHRMQIHARDLRILDPLLSYPSTILGRERAIVLNLEHIKAIITSEGVLLRDPSDENVTSIVEELRRRLKPMNANRDDQGEEKDLNVQHDNEPTEEDESPFEFQALEVALEDICSYLAARTLELETAVYPALDMLTSKISSRNLDRVRKLKSQMTRLTARVQKVRDELEQLLDDDDDMADLHLSRKLAGASPVSGSGAASWFIDSPIIGSKISRASRASIATVRGDENDVEELEMLLEAYFMQIDGTFNKLTTLREYIDNTDDYINIQLDNHRNQLIQVLSIGISYVAYLSFTIIFFSYCVIDNQVETHDENHVYVHGFSSCRLQLELFLSSGTLCLSIYSLIGGIFGMNIPFSWNAGHSYMFRWVVIVSGIICVVIFILIMSYARYKGLVGS